MADIFELTTRPDLRLFYRRNDANDPRLGEVVRADPASYDAAQIVLLGAPQDEGVRRNQGRPGAALAPDDIRDCFYRLSTTALGNGRLACFDLGNITLQDTLEATHANQQSVVRQVIEDGKTLIVLGGGNDISYPDCSGLALAVGDVLGFNIDAHFDVRADSPRNSGTPYRQLLEEGYLKPGRFFEMAYQPFANSRVYLDYLAGKGVDVYSLRALRADGLLATFHRLLDASDAAAVFWGFDLDSVRAADAPGVSAPNAVGLTGDELCDLAALAGTEPRTRLIEFAEVNPTHDIDRRTCRLTAVAIWNFLAAITQRLYP